MVFYLKCSFYGISNKVLVIFLNEKNFMEILFCFIMDME